MWISGAESRTLDSQMLGAVVGRKGFIKCDQGILTYSVIGV